MQAPSSRPPVTTDRSARASPQRINLSNWAERRTGRLDPHAPLLSKLWHWVLRQSWKYRKNLTACPHPRQPRKTLANTSKRRRAHRQSSLCCTRHHNELVATLRVESCEQDVDENQVPESRKPLPLPCRRAGLTHPVPIRARATC